MYWFFLVSLSIFMLTQTAAGETYYVDITKGDNNNTGSFESPFKTIQKAVEAVNALTGEGEVTIKVAPGLYSFDNPCLIKPSRSFSEKDRLIIEATILPDDADWTPEQMPVIITSQSVLPVENQFTEAWSLNVETSHVTIQGIKFLGTPIPHLMYYPIFRKGMNLEDLVVSQCMFINDMQVTSMNVGVIANGHGLKIDHCVFYWCSNAVVFWDAEGGISRNNSITNCIIYGGCVSGVWLCQTADDFIFNNNIVTNCTYPFMRSDPNKTAYKISKSIISEYQDFSGRSSDGSAMTETGPEVVYAEEDVIKSGEIQLEISLGLDVSIPRRHLHVQEGTPGFELNAGLFTK